MLPDLGQTSTREPCRTRQPSRCSEAPGVSFGSLPRSAWGTAYGRSEVQGHEAFRHVARKWASKAQDGASLHGFRITRRGASRSGTPRLLRLRKSEIAAFRERPQTWNIANMSEWSAFSGTFTSPLRASVVVGLCGKFGLSQARRPPARSASSRRGRPSHPSRRRPHPSPRPPPSPRPRSPPLSPRLPPRWRP